MRILILSENTCGGNSSAALALEEQLHKMNVSCEIFDALSLLPEKMPHLVRCGHTYVSRRLPFGRPRRYDEQQSPRKTYEYCAKGAAALQEKLISEPFDAVISVHVLAALMMTEVKRAYGNIIPTYFIATDYACSPGVSKINADEYFIPHRMLLGDFVRAMIPANKLYATGIPVMNEFYSQIDRVEARRMLEIPEEGRLLLISCGSSGLGRMEKYAPELYDRLPDDVHTVVLCGKNQELYNDLSRFNSRRFTAVDYTDRIATYMSAADLYLTKPGGLMTTEALAKGLPMVFVDAVPGCETKNYKFLVQNGVAEGGKSWAQAMEQAIRLLSKPTALEELRGRMEGFLPSTAAEQICKHVLKR